MDNGPKQPLRFENVFSQDFTKSDKANEAYERKAGGLLRESSFNSNNMSITEKYSQINKPEALDYFNDSSKNPKSQVKQPENDYYPFGRPGGGAPNRDDQGYLINKRPANQFSAPPDPVSLQSLGSKPSSKWTFDEHQALRDKKKEEWRQSLLEQVQEREKKKQAEKENILMQERMQEEKLERERVELEKKYKNEIRVEQGLPFDEESDRNRNVEVRERVKAIERKKEQRNKKREKLKKKQ